jgi:hypothetical protein
MLHSEKIIAANNKLIKKFNEDNGVHLNVV